MIQRNKPASLYLHVPFCAHICYYCDFAHTVYTEKTAEEWLAAVEREIESKNINRKLKTIYIGGGTPTSLNAGQLDRLFALLEPYAEEVLEYTAEINPETLDEEKAAILASHGVNRVSIGLQSSDADMLQKLGRKHTFEDTAECVERIRRHGIDNISLDLMYSLPHQTMTILQKSFYDACSLKPRHLSLYSLTVEENTVFGKRGYEHLDDETEADMYEWLVQACQENGYHQYEISNFAKDGYESRHNLVYWRYEDFYGISCGASGKEENVRYDHVRNIQDYIAEPLKTEKTVLSEEDEMFEFVMMGLRMKEGILLQRFADRFLRSFDSVFGTKAQSLCEKGLLEYQNGCIRCTDQGYAILNSVLVELM